MLDLPRSPLRGSSRRSVTARLSRLVATRLSMVGVSEVPRDGTVAVATINTLCNIMGAGVLSLPLAFYNASIVVGIIMMLYVAFMSMYAVYCLVVGCDATGRYSLTEVCAFAMFPSRSFSAYQVATRRPSATAVTSDEEHAAIRMSEHREDRAAHARDELHRRRMRRVVLVFVESVIFLNNFGTLVVYAKVIAESMPPVVEHVFGVGGIVVSELFWLVISGVVFFVLSCMRNMDELKWTSLLGFTTILYVVLAVVFRYATARLYDNPHVPRGERGHISWFRCSVGMLKSVSTFGMAFGYHFNVPYFYKELRLRVPREMMKSVGIAFPTVIACYLASGVLGYLTFGNLVAMKKAAGNIVANYSKNDAVVNVGRLGLFAHFACVFPIISICARRGLHRLVMTALTWGELSEMMELAVEEDNAWREGDSTMRTLTSPTAPPALPPVLTADGRDGAPPDERQALLSPALRSYQSFPTLELPVSLDKDVGAPEDTTQLAITVEAFALVTLAVVLAKLIPGIAFVIEIIGTLFGIFLVLIAPGVVGWCVFSASYQANHADAATLRGQPEVGADVFPGAAVGSQVHRFLRLKRGLCVLSIISGIFFSSVGTVYIVKSFVK